MISIDLAISWIAGFVLTISPITSYLDTVINIYRTQSSAGFSLDVCGIMLISSFLKVFFYFGRPYEFSLYLQAWVMIFIQVILLKFALDHRPRQWSGGPLDRDPSQPQSKIVSRPWSFWVWDNPKTYWILLSRFVGVLAILQVVLGKISLYVESIGLIGLLIEAILPLPQILTNSARGSVEGFRPSLLFSWLAGDLSKLAFFTFSWSKGSSSVAPQFLICAGVQALLDAFVGVQYYMYSTGKWTASQHQQVIASRQRANSLKQVQPRP